jgi:hypothetical protein
VARAKEYDPNCPIIYGLEAFIVTQEYRLEKKATDEAGYKRIFDLNDKAIELFNDPQNQRFVRFRPTALMNYCTVLFEYAALVEARGDKDKLRQSLEKIAKLAAQAAGDLGKPAMAWDAVGLARERLAFAFDNDPKAYEAAVEAYGEAVKAARNTLELASLDRDAESQDELDDAAQKMGKCLLDGGRAWFRYGEFAARDPRTPSRFAEAAELLRDAPSQLEEGLKAKELTPGRKAELSDHLAEARYWRGLALHAQRNYPGAAAALAEVPPGSRWGWRARRDRVLALVEAAEAAARGVPPGDRAKPLKDARALLNLDGLALDAAAKMVAEAELEFLKARLAEAEDGPTAARDAYDTLVKTEDPPKSRAVVEAGLALQRAALARTVRPSPELLKAVTDLRKAVEAEPTRFPAASRAAAYGLAGMAESRSGREALEAGARHLREACRLTTAGDPEGWLWRFEAAKAVYRADEKNGKEVERLANEALDAAPKSRKDEIAKFIQSL